MKHPTATLEGANLDYAVAMACGYKLVSTGHAWEIFSGVPDGMSVPYMGGIPLPEITGAAREALHTFRPSTEWIWGGPIIDREDMYIGPCSASIGSPAFVMIGGIHGYHAQHPSGARSYGKTYLIAAMRCFVASKLGEEVEIP